jgi:protein involved in polysaccharide export with SLBB domain
MPRNRAYVVVTNIEYSTSYDNVPPPQAYISFVIVDPSGALVLSGGAPVSIAGSNLEDIREAIVDNLRTVQTTDPNLAVNFLMG